jgi:hypothetical protein
MVLEQHLLDDVKGNGFRSMAGVLQQQVALAVEQGGESGRSGGQPLRNLGVQLRDARRIGGTG